MKRYLKLIVRFAKYGLMASLEFRLNFIGWSIAALIWALLFIVGVELVFGEVRTVAGWTRSEVLILAAIHTLFVSALWVFIFPNLFNFSRLIRHGNLDFYLLKPVNHRFLVSTAKFEYDQFLRVVVLTYLFFKFIDDAGLQISVSAWIMFVLLFLLGLFIFYNVFFVLVTTNFWFINIFNFEDFFHTVLDTGRFPTDIYKGVLSLLFTYIVPVAFVASFPTKALLGESSVGYLYSAVIIALVTFVLSQWFWLFALKYYHSASS